MGLATLKCLQMAKQLQKPKQQKMFLQPKNMFAIHLLHHIGNQVIICVQ
jgi:hypothetical protein